MTYGQNRDASLAPLFGNAGARDGGWMRLVELAHFRARG